MVELRSKFMEMRYRNKEVDALNCLALSISLKKYTETAFQKNLLFNST